MKPRFYLANFVASVPLLLVMEYYFRGIQYATDAEAYPVKVLTVTALVLGSLVLQAVILHPMRDKGFRQAVNVASTIWLFFCLILTVEAFTLRPLLAHDMDRTLATFLFLFCVFFVVFALPVAVATSLLYVVCREGYSRWVRTL